MANIKSVGKARNSWSEWIEPEKWNHNDIPPCPGVYQLAVFKNNNMECINNINNSKKSYHEENKGIVYIGKAICLYERFWRLIQSWLPTPSNTLHDSRESYNENFNQTQNIFDPYRMRCRFKSLSSIDWKAFRNRISCAKKSPKNSFEKLSLLWPDSGQGHSLPSAVATFSEEGSLMKKFRSYYGILPLLNKQGPEVLGDQPNDYFYQKIWEEMEELDVFLNEEIYKTAYYNWINRGCPINDDWTDWFYAEQIIWDKMLE